MYNDNTTTALKCEFKSDLAEATIEFLLKSRGVSGFGQYHTANPKSENPKPYIELPWGDILSMVKNPGSIPKEKAQWAIFSRANGPYARVHQWQRDNGQFFCAWGDIDDVSGLTMLDVINRAREALPGIQHIIYSSRSARPDLPKSRILVPFSGIVQGADYSMIQKILNDRLEAAGLPPDRASERPGQLCYLPNRGEFYEYQIIDGPLLDPCQAFESEIIAEQARLKKEQEQRDRRHRAAIPVEAYRQNYPVELALEQYGYVRRGNKWISPIVFFT